jgi:hypothetical protein
MGNTGASVDWHHPIESAKRIGGEVAKHPGDLIAGNLGFQPAPAYIQNSEALNMAREYARTNNPPGTHIAVIGRGIQFPMLPLRG